MSVGEIANYQGVLGMTDVIAEGFEIYIKIYNDTTAALTNGDVVALDWGADADSNDPVIYYTVKTPATVAVPTLFGVVNNVKLNKSTIADTEWGYVQIRGFCPDVNTNTSSVAAGRFLQGLNSAKTAADDGTSQTTDSLGVAVSALFSTSHVKAILFGNPVIIG